MAENNMPTKPDDVPFIAFEHEMARAERHIKRLSIVLAIAIIFGIIGTFGTAMVFLWYLDQYDFVSYQQDGEGINIVGDRNGVDYINGAEGESEGQEEPFKFPWQSIP